MSGKFNTRSLGRMTWEPDTQNTLAYKCLDTKHIRHFSQMDIVEPGSVTESSSCPLTHPRKETLHWRKDHCHCCEMVPWWEHKWLHSLLILTRKIRHVNGQRIRLLSLYNLCFCLTLCNISLWSQRLLLCLGDKGCEIRVGARMWNYKILESKTSLEERPWRCEHNRSVSQRRSKLRLREAMWLAQRGSSSVRADLWFWTLDITLSACCSISSCLTIITTPHFNRKEGNERREDETVTAWRQLRMKTPLSCFS